MNEPPNRWNPDTRPETPPPVPVGQPFGSVRPKSEPPQPDPDAAGPTLEDLARLELQAIVGASSSFSGTLSFAGRARIDGELEGVVRGGLLLVIGEGAEVRGRIQAERVIVVGGKVHADIVASRAIELYVPSEVTGELQSPQIYIERGVQFHGTCDMSLPTAETPSAGVSRRPVPQID